MNKFDITHEGSFDSLFDDIISAFNIFNFRSFGEQQMAPHGVSFGVILFSLQSVSNLHKKNISISY